MNRLEKIIFSIGIFFLGTEVVLAVPPPDFIFNVGAQVAQFFSVAVLFLGAILAMARQTAKVYFMHLKNNKIIWTGLILGVFGLGSAGAYYYGQYQQTVEYEKWRSESKIQNLDIPVSDTDLDQLKLNGESSVPVEKIQRPKESPEVQFIQTYYENLSNGQVEAAYEVSKKSASLATYKSWYTDVTSLNIDALQQIDEHTFSLKLTLNEGEQSTHYAVLMTLVRDAQGNFRIADSDVRVLSSDQTDIIPELLPENMAVTQLNFYYENKDLPLVVSNNDFQLVVSNDIFVLDAREDEEFEIGRFPGSTHIRFADLIAGEWIALPADQIVYVFCWSGIRGKEVADFLRTKKIVARYVEYGADGWVSFGGEWEGGIKFLSKYPQKQYTYLLSLDELKEKVSQGAVVVDSRISDKYLKWHIPGSINIPIIYTPSSRIDELLDQVSSGMPVITVCDDFVSCFDAKITGLKLEKNGHEFLGRYNKPWEYRNAQ